MARYGTFDTLSRLHRSSQASVWSARMAMSHDDLATHCVKRVELSERELQDGDTSSAEGLLIAAALQQAMGFKSVGWVPVYHLGTNGTDAFYATDLFPRSAQTLIDGRATLRSTDLRTILAAVVDGLIELHAQYGRAHGNLKPSNVLIGERIRPGLVCLTDPAAHIEDVPEAPIADRRALGRLLYGLATHRPYTRTCWPLVFDDAWQALGTSGRDWFDLCESLLHPLVDGEPNLDHLLTRIVTVHPTRRRLRRAALLAPVLAGVAAVGYVGRGHVTAWFGPEDHLPAPIVPDRQATVLAPIAQSIGPTNQPSRQ